MKRLLLLAALALLSGCVTAVSQKAAPPSYTPNFHFAPPASSTTDAQVTIALINPNFASQTVASEIFPEFSSNMASDFQQLISARGYKFKGPYRSYDMMVYGDKQVSDLLMTASIDMPATISDISVTTIVNILGGPRQYQIKTAHVRLSGNVALAITEPLTQMKLWVKEVPVPTTEFEFQGQTKYSEPPGPVNAAEPDLRSKLGRALEQTYRNVMQASWDYLDPQEMRALKAQAQEIRKKAGFPVSTE